ncbi:MAG: TrkH family potassium uptake protein [Lachnospiraceae bacterium]|nr:TrkH family potassium uptake protein [Lachnospiraceae bacterium]
MNSSMIRVILGHVLRIEAAFMLLPCLIALIYREKEGYIYLIVAGACALIGVIMSAIKKPTDSALYLKEGCVATALSWIMLSLFGALPFCLTGEIPSYVDSLFETISGFTTTGASILNDVESLSYTSLFWRSFTHWIGGMGVLVFLLAIIPLSGGSNINLMRAESPGPSVGKLVPKIKSSARILYVIYFIMTIAEMGLLTIGGMKPFHAITLSMGTAGTGGFGVLNSSIASYSSYCQWVITVFMILFGVNFNAFYFILIGKVRKFFEVEEVRWYLGIILAAILMVSINIRGVYGSVSETVRNAAFQVASIITTTGYSTTDFNIWPMFSKVILVVLMFIGACAGSTGGGIKVSRIVIMLKTVKKELNNYSHPKSIKKIMFEKKAVEHEVLRAINVYLITFIIIFTLSLTLLSFEDHDFSTTFTAVAATINNIGPGLNMVGPTGNFAFWSIPSKFVLMIDMLAGRLELFPLLILFSPKVLKELVIDSFAKRK